MMIWVVVVITVMMVFFYEFDVDGEFDKDIDGDFNKDIDGEFDVGRRNVFTQLHAWPLVPAHTARDDWLIGTW